MFHIGQHVVCVNDEERAFVIPGHSYIGDLNGLKRGNVYTIRGIAPAPRHYAGCVLMVSLEEIHRGSMAGGGEAGFALERFRPLDEAKLAIFRALLVTPPRETEPVLKAHAPTP